MGLDLVKALTDNLIAIGAVEATLCLDAKGSELDI